MQWRPAKHYSPAEVEADQMPVLSNPDNSSPSQVSDSGADPNISTNRPWRRHSFRVALAFGVGGVAAAAVIFYGVNDTVIDEEETITRAVVSAEVRDLVEFNDLSGRMVYADVKPIVSSEDGVITDVLQSGDTIERGTVLYAINDSPTAAFYGTFPLYRKLSEGAVGEDVIVLKKNLSALGYHSFEEDDGTIIDTGFVVDNVFDDSTTEAVKRWQKDQGAEESGVVSPSDVIVLNGPAEVADVSTDVGQRVNLGTRIMDLNMLGIVDTVHYEHSGQVETLVTSGQEIASGDLLYAIDNRAVTAMISEATFDRNIEEGVKSGDDVRAVEDMLFSLGYDVKGDLEVDDVFDDVTKQAITEWQEDLGRTFDGVVVNGIISLGDLIVFAPGTVAGSITDYEDGTIASGSVLWSSSTETAARVIETSISVADQDKLAMGNVVDIEFPDGEITQGTVTSVATSTTVDPMNPEAEPTIAIELSIAQVPTSVRDFNQVNVQVKLVEHIATGATVVPVSALVATGDGNFAVEAITTTGTTFLQVRPGMFSDGWVEVTGIQPGTQVVVPS